MTLADKEKHMTTLNFIQGSFSAMESHVTHLDQEVKSVSENECFRYSNLSTPLTKLQRQIDTYLEIHSQQQQPPKVGTRRPLHKRGAAHPSQRTHLQC
jgi:hypothetical protein